MFYKLLLPFILSFLLVAAKTSAQETETAEASVEKETIIKRYKYEIGTNLKWIFVSTIINQYPNTAHSYSYNNNGMRLFGRINKSKSIPAKYTNRKYAYRFGLRLNGSLTFYNNIDTIIAVNPSPYESIVYKNHHYFSILAESGYEIQKQLKRFQLFYGADAGISYLKSSSDVYLYNRSNPDVFVERSKNQTSNYSLVLSPLLGVKYFIHSRVSVSGEAKFNLGLYVDKSKDGYFGITSNTAGLNIWTDPLYALNLNYYFN
jgi:hypothetical protein